MFVGCDACLLLSHLSSFCLFSSCLLFSSRLVSSPFDSLSSSEVSIYRSLQSLDRPSSPSSTAAQLYISESLHLHISLYLCIYIPPPQRAKRLGRYGPIGNRKRERKKKEMFLLQQSVLLPPPLILVGFFFLHTFPCTFSLAYVLITSAVIYIMGSCWIG